MKKTDLWDWRKTGGCYDVEVDGVRCRVYSQGIVDVLGKSRWERCRDSQITEAAITLALAANEKNIAAGETHNRAREEERLRDQSATDFLVASGYFWCEGWPEKSSVDYLEDRRGFAIPTSWMSSPKGDVVRLWERQAVATALGWSAQ